MATAAQSPRARGRIRVPMAEARTRLWAAYVLVGAVATGLYFALAGLPTVQDQLYDLIGLSAVAAIVVGVRKSRVSRPLPWYLVAGGLLAYVLGDFSYTLYDFYLGTDPPYSFFADTFYLAGYPLLAAGIVLLIRGIDRVRSRTGLIDATIFAVAFAVAGWMFVIDPLSQADYPLVDRLIRIAYPSMDLLLLGVLARLLLTRSRHALSYRQLVAAILLQLGADVVYYSGASEAVWLNACWLLSYVLWGAAALHPSVVTLSLGVAGSEPRLTRLRLAALAAALLAGPAMLLALWLAGREGYVVAISLGAAGIALLVLARLAGLVRVTERAHAAEREARTRAEESERLLAEQNEQLRELDRAKDEFVSLVSHELRTPLTSVIGYLELVREEPGGLSGDQLRFLTVVERNSRRLAGLVEDLLLIARLRAGRLRLVQAELDLAGLAEESVEAARPSAAGRGVELVHTTRPSFLVGDRTRLAQLLDNLVSNAVKFTPGGGRVDVVVYSEREKVRLTVSDTGIGIAADEQGRLFDRFFRASTATSREIPGTGLGLAIVKAIVDAHGGTISVVSELGRGTTFQIELPTGDVSAPLEAAARLAA